MNVAYACEKTPAAQQRMKPAVGKVVNTLKSALEVRHTYIHIQLENCKRFATTSRLFSKITLKRNSAGNCCTQALQHEGGLRESAIVGGGQLDKFHVEAKDSTTQYLCSQVRAPDR